MGKIRVEDLAQMMGIANQDLIFKLKSIGVRLDDKNPTIDSEVIEAVLQGKSLRHPREVILRDKEARATAPPAPRRRPPTRRLPAAPRRPGRRRVIIQKVEPRIKTIPTSDRVAPPPAETRTPEKAPAATAPPVDSQARVEPARRPARRDQQRDDDERRAKRARRAVRDEAAPEEDLRAYRGSLAEIEKVEEEKTAAAPSARRKRRVQRRKQEAEAGKILTFKQDAPAGAVTVTEGMTLREFAEKLGVKAKDLIKVLVGRGMMVTINHVLDPKLAVDVAAELGLEAKEVSFEEEVQLQHASDAAESAAAETRAPVVTIMGHVDHGKTTLLDSIRSSKITESEHGGITQHIGAYQVKTRGRKVVFLDTPGHEAFTMMRARGAKATDLVVLVVAADDGVMPQTVEAVDHARAAEVPIVVAVNKIDKPNASPDKVKKELADLGLTVEEWGGDTVSIGISALDGTGIPELLEMILLTADLLELKADPGLPAQGVVLEAKKDPRRGIVATVLVQNGTLLVGDVFVAGATWGRVRSMSDDRGLGVEAAEPATPVEVTGLNDVPEAGDAFQVVEEEAKARNIAEFRQQEQRKRELAPTPSRVSLEQLFGQIQEGAVKELPVVLKGDVQGSVEVLKDTLAKLSTDQVKIQVIHAGVGAITTNDVILASASNAIIVGFNVRPEKNAAELAEREQVDVRLHTVIYEISDELRKAMTGLLEPTYREVVRGRAEVREIFNIPRHGTVAGSHVLEGVIRRGNKVRLLRDNVVSYEGSIASLRRFKEDVSEVRTGFDCGIRLERFQDVKPGDVLEVYEKEAVAPTLQ